MTGTLRGGRSRPRYGCDWFPATAMSGSARSRYMVSVDRVAGGGRTALNLGGIDAGDLHRGMVLTADDAVVATDRLLAAFRGPAADRERGRFHIRTAAVDGTIGRAAATSWRSEDGVGDRPSERAGRPSARGSLRPPSRDPRSARRGRRARYGTGAGISRRRQTSERRLAPSCGTADARLELHGFAEGSTA